MYQKPEGQIRDLLARYIKGECTEEEVVLLEKWYDRISGDKESVRMLSADDEERLVANLWKMAGRERYQRRRRLMRYAAVWAGVIVVSGGIWLAWSKRQKSALARTDESTVVNTGYQQVRKVLLPDSSIVWLNSATHLSYHSDFVNNREILLSGEAFFQVRPDVQHPFVVKAGGVSTRVYGTTFNVMAYAEARQLRVSLQSGKVEVEFDEGKGRASKLLTAGQLLIYDKEPGAGRVMRQAPGEMDEWTAGRLLFFETPLKEALAQVEARYGIHIVYDQPLKDQTITARFENTALEKVLEHLSFGWDLHFVRKGDSLHVSQGK
ncbi:MAG: FecR domain-containing protein [Bacteroidetes bacterium]|nr:FecR domain-containing protein [Bacteroidota bacterium]